MNAQTNPMNITNLITDVDIISLHQINPKVVVILGLYCQCSFEICIYMHLCKTRGTLCTRNEPARYLRGGGGGGGTCYLLCLFLLSRPYNEVCGEWVGKGTGG